jgi:hypothetical protein
MRSIAVGVLAAAVGCAEGDLETPAPAETTTVSGAGFMTFDAVVDGCQNTSGGSRCNAYETKESVFVSSGPHGALANGTYVFAVLTPGLDGNIGNLSEKRAVGDSLADRTFAVEDHEIVGYGGTHAVGATIDGRVAINVGAFDDTDHPAGVYVLAICASDAVEPSQCTYDAFRVGRSEPLPIVRGSVYVDTNLDGLWGDDEPAVPEWSVDYHGTISGSVTSQRDGSFALELLPDGYLFLARQMVGDDASHWVEAAVDHSISGLHIGIAADAR